MPLMQDLLSIAIIAFIILAIIAKRKGQSILETFRDMVDNLKGGENE